MVATSNCALATYSITKIIDLCIDFATDKRKFKKHRRELALSDIEDLKDDTNKALVSSGSSPLTWSYFVY